MAETTKKPTLDKDIFSVEVTNHELLKLTYDSYLANSRSANAKTLTRAEVRGGGKKPWKQKGTGRARFGSTRNPIWRHGGIVGGPTGNENYTKKLSRNMVTTAVIQALSVKNAAKAVQLVADFAPKDGKTKEAIKYLESNKAEGNVLLVVNDKTNEILRATSNISTMKVVRPAYLNVFDLMNADAILITESAVTAISERLKGGK